MFNQKFTLQSDFVDSFLNRVILQSRYGNSHNIVNDASVFEGCVNLNTFNLNFSECGNKRDSVNSFIEANELGAFKQQVSEACNSEILEAFSLVHLQHRQPNVSVFNGLLNQVALKESLNNLSQCIAKI